MYVRDGVKAFFHRLRTVDIHTQITTEYVEVVER